jgi:hypothetical protein
VTFTQAPGLELLTNQAISDQSSLAIAVSKGAFGHRGGFAHAFTDAQVANVVRLIDDAKLVQAIEQWRQSDSLERHAGGRPSVLNDRAMITAMLLLALDGTGVLITRVGELFQHRLSDNAKALLGVDPATTGSFVEWNNRSWRAFHRITELVDGFATPKRSRLTRTQYAEIEAKRNGDPETLTAKQDRLDWFCNQLLEATLHLLPRRVRRRWKGSISFDATFTAAFARGTRRDSTHCSIEPDAGWYVREGDHRDTPPPDGKKPLRKWGYGWETTIAISTSTDEQNSFPHLAVAMAFDKPGHHITKCATTLVSSLNKREHPVGYAVADRAYFPNAKPNELQLPLRALGYKLVFDYREDQLGIIATHKGAILVEGNWYCPSMPKILISATIDYRAKTDPINPTEYAQRIKQRVRYLLKPKATPDEDGYQIWSCPAFGEYATVACDLKPESVRSLRAGGRTRIPVNEQPRLPDAICAQKSVTFAPTEAAKYTQPLQYASETWRTIYSTARNAIEGFNGYIKDPNRTALGSSGLRRVRGRSAQQFLVAFLICASNVAKVRTWLAKHPNDANEVHLPKTSRVKRRRNSITKYVISTATDPPITPKPPNRSN